MKCKAIALCRVSTVKQRLEGNSLEAQEARVYNAAAFLDAEIIKIWSLNTSSKKGVNRKRKDLQEMLTFCRHHKSVKYLIVDEVDRFMRSIGEYYWFKEEFKHLGVEIRFASKPHLSGNDQIAIFDEMIDIYRAESSNIERSTKTTDKMKARVAVGYYPGAPKQGYQRSMTPGLHEPKEPQWSMLKEAFSEILSQRWTAQEVLKRLNARGYKTTHGSDLDMERFKCILFDPYYAGAIQFSNWEPCLRGLHKAMITLEQHEQLKVIVDGKKKFTRKQFNPKYRLSNLMACTDCLHDVNARYPRLVGYDHNNGKPGSKRKVYESYKSRCCKVEQKRQVVHDGLNAILGPLELEPSKRDEFLAALRLVWQQEHQDNARFVQTLQQRQSALIADKDSLVMAMAVGKISDGDGNSALASIKEKIRSVGDELNAAQDIEQD